MKTPKKIRKIILAVCAFLTVAAGASAMRTGQAPLSPMTPTGQYALEMRDIKSARTGIVNSGIPRASLSAYNLIPLVAGDLDAEFDGDGRVTTQLGGAEDVALSVALQPDGKIVSAGYSSTGVSNVAFVVRYNFDGSLDTTFDGDGKVTQDFGVGFTTATSIALQADGKILVAGYTRAALPAAGFDFFLLRYNSDGTLDLSFDTDGKVTTDFASRDEASAVFIQSDGKIVLVGNTTNNTPDRTFAALARYNSDGSLDTSFDTDGKVLSHEGAAFSVVIQPDGQIVTSGWGCSTATCTQNLDFTFARYNTNGSLDASFGTAGKATVAVSTGRDEAREISLQPDGKIVAVGAILGAAAGDPAAIVRLNTNGTLDTSFGTGGIVQNLPIAVENAFGLRLQPNGKVLAGGRVYPVLTDSDFALVRLNTDGTLDTTFSDDGIAMTAFANNLDGIIDIAIQSDGRIVAVGFAENQIGDVDAAVARYLAQANVSVGGRVTTPNGLGLRNAIVSITDPQSVKRTVLTSSFGFYTFDNLVANQTYVIAVTSKRYRFSSQVLLINDNLINVDFVGQE